MTAALALAMAVTAGAPDAATPCAGCHASRAALLPAATPPSDVAAARAALDAVDALDLAAARAALLPFGPPDRAGAAVRLAAGVLALHEQRYAEAGALLASAGAGGTAVEVARAGVEVLEGHRHHVERTFHVAYPAPLAGLLAPLLDTLERQEAALALLLGGAPPGRVPVEIVTRPRDLARLAGLRDADVVESGTRAAVRFGKLLLLAPASGRADRGWLDTAAHEYTHLALAVRTRDRLPIWLQEGFAGFLEARWRGGAVSLSPDALARVRHAAERGRLVPLAEMHPTLARLENGRAALAQAQVVLVVEHLAARAGPRSLAAVVEGVRAGEAPDAVVARVAGAPLARVLDDAARHLATRPLPEAAWRTLHGLRAAGRAGGKG